MICGWLCTKLTICISCSHSVCRCLVRKYEGKRTSAIYRLDGGTPREYRANEKKKNWDVGTFFLIVCLHFNGGVVVIVSKNGGAWWWLLSWLLHPPPTDRPTDIHLHKKNPGIDFIGTGVGGAARATTITDSIRISNIENDYHHHPTHSLLVYYFMIISPVV